MLLLDSVGETSNLFFASIYNMPILYFLTIIFSALFVGNDFGGRTLQSYINAGHRRGKIQTFYDLSVIDAKEVTPVREDFNLTNLLINLITENAPALEAKGISPVIGLPDHSVYLHSDYGMVERIFQNLIINAIRYSSGSIKIDLKQGKEKSAIFIIENPIDSKVEIDPNRLFERFYTGDKSRHNSGTGVGLAVVKLLTDKLGGNVFAKIENDTLTISLEIK